MTIGKLPVGGTFTKKSPRSRLSARSVLLPSAEVSTGHPHPPKTAQSLRSHIRGGRENDLLVGCSRLIV